MHTRRIVTGLSSGRRAVVISDGVSPRSVDATHVAGLRTELLWQTSATGTLPVGSGHDPVRDATSFLPGLGETSIQVVTFPPESAVEVAPADRASDYAKAMPGLSERFESENPGMHVTDTVDYCVLLEGELQMELDDGLTLPVRQHDVVIQNGTRHGWRNRSGRPATMLFVLIGVARQTARA